MAATVIDHPMRATLERAHRAAQARRFEAVIEYDDGTTSTEPLVGSYCDVAFAALDRIEAMGGNASISMRGRA
jgi:hypothetical protein